MATIEIHNIDGEEQDQPRVVNGTIKQYAKENSFNNGRNPYFIIRDPDTHESLTAPLWRFKQVYTNEQIDEGLKIVYVGVERVKTGDTTTEYPQKWTVYFCGRPTDESVGELRELSQAAKNEGVFIDDTKPPVYDEDIENLEL